MQPLRDSSGRGDMDSSVRSTNSAGSSNGQRRISTSQQPANNNNNSYGSAVNSTNSAAAAAAAAAGRLGMQQQHPSSFPGGPSSPAGSQHYSLPGQPLAAPPNAQQQQQRLFQMQQSQQHQLQLQQLQQQRQRQQQQLQQQQQQQQQRQKNPQQQQHHQQQLPLQSRQSQPQQQSTTSQRHGSASSRSSLQSQPPSSSSMNPQNSSSSHRSNGPSTTVPNTDRTPPPPPNSNNNTFLQPSTNSTQQQLHQQSQPQQKILQRNKAAEAPTQNSAPGPKQPPNDATAAPIIPPPTAPLSRTSTASSAVAASSASAKASSSSQHPQHSSAAATAAPPPISNAEAVALLAKCDWKDRTVWVSRQLFGGQSMNGFLRSTATVQRIKKQRARQTKESSKKAEAANKGDDASVASKESGAVSTTTTTTAAASVASNNKKRGIADPEQAAEEELKHKIMNARTAKKIKSELEVGVNFCEMLHGVVRGILADMPDTGIQVPPPLGRELPGVPRPPNFPQVAAAAAAATAKAANAAATAAATQKPPPTTTKKPAPAKPAPSPMAAKPAVSSMSLQQSTISAGNPNGSTLRKHRKKKLPSNAEPPVNLPEFEASGKRICTKKEHMLRVFQIMRFRSLRQGDHVAARVSSRDLWILARVVKDFPGVTLTPVEFLRLSDTRRDQLFRQKVLIKDVEDKESGATPVARNLILPLPRTFSEAAEWGQNYKKGSRVYAMYPQTTSLYTATVMDNTTYCRDDDDIIVVEFDGDEADETGSIPRCHIPARFVTLIPREFPGAQAQNKKRRPSLESNSNAKTTKTAASSTAGAPSAKPPGPEMEDALNALGDMPFDDMPGLGDFDELDFDLGFTG